MINPTKRVVVTKLAEAREGLVPVGYWAKGMLTSPVVIGESVWMDRDENCETTPSKIAGRFNTSSVQKIVPTQAGVALVTKNSVWLLENCEP